MYYTHDGNRNVSEVVAANGDIVAHYEYAPFGAVVEQQGALAAVNPWRFSSEHTDGDIGLVYYNFRHYDPAAGRWLSREEFAIDSQNHYEYLSNAPTTTIDHLGLYDERVHFYLMYILMTELLEDDLDDDLRRAKALEIARGSQYPDLREEFDALRNSAYHETLHNLNNLTCCDLEKYKKCIACNLKKQGDPFLKGVYLHVLADTFSHVRFKVGKDKICSYSPGIGHFFDGTKPDDPQFRDIGKDRLDKLIKELEGLFGKRYRQT